MLQRARLLRKGVSEQTEHGLGAASLKGIVMEQHCQVGYDGNARNSVKVSVIFITRT